MRTLALAPEEPKSALLLVLQLATERGWAVLHTLQLRQTAPSRALACLLKVRGFCPRV